MEGRKAKTYRLLVKKLKQLLKELGVIQLLRNLYHHWTLSSTESRPHVTLFLEDPSEYYPCIYS
jgi:hypothetical protein